MTAHFMAHWCWANVLTLWGMVGALLIVGGTLGFMAAWCESRGWITQYCWGLGFCLLTAVTFFVGCHKC